MVTRAIVLAHRMVLEGGSTLSASMIAMVRRSLTALHQAGIRDVAVVDGEHAEELLERLNVHELTGMNVRCYSNRSWQQASGSAVLIAKDFLSSEATPCLILRGDRPLAREALAELCSTDLGTNIASICVSTPPTANLSEEYKVKLRGGRTGKGVSSLGLDLGDFDAVYTGHALVTPELLPELQKLSNPHLEDAFNALAVAGRVRMQMGRTAWPWGMSNPASLDAEVSAILESKQHPEYTLLNPGPVNTTARVKSAMVHHDAVSYTHLTLPTSDLV